MKTNPEKNFPYFSLFVVPEKDSSGEWEEIGAFWKAKSGKGYTGNFAKGLNITGTKQKSGKKVQSEIKQDDSQSD